LRHGSDFRPHRSSLRDVAELFIASLLFGAAMRFDVFWAKHALPPSEAGTYAISASIAAVLYMITSSIGRVTTVSLRSGSGERVIVFSYAATFGVAALIAGGFAAFGQRTLLTLVGRPVDFDWSVLSLLFSALTWYSVITLDYSCLNVMTKRVHVGMGLALIIVLATAVSQFGTGAWSIALSFCATMTIMSGAFSVMLWRGTRKGRDVKAHPATTHLAQGLTQ
jgi:hypothetical protein